MKQKNQTATCMGTFQLNNYCKQRPHREKVSSQQHTVAWSKTFYYDSQKHLLLSDIGNKLVSSCNHNSTILAYAAKNTDCTLLVRGIYKPSFCVFQEKQGLRSVCHRDPQLLCEKSSPSPQENMLRITQAERRSEKQIPTKKSIISFARSRIKFELKIHKQSYCVITGIKMKWTQQFENTFLLSLLDYGQSQTGGKPVTPPPPDRTIGRPRWEGACSTTSVPGQKMPWVYS